MKKLTFNDYIILIILCLFILSTILGIGWYNEHKNKVDNINTLSIELEQYKLNELNLTKSIVTKQMKIKELNIINDSLNSEIVEIDKKRKINYNKYQNELKKDKQIITIKSANIVVDSILRANNIRR
jgi:hypothetical protein